MDQSDVADDGFVPADVAVGFPAGVGGQPNHVCFCIQGRGPELLNLQMGRKKKKKERKAVGKKGRKKIKKKRTHMSGPVAVIASGTGGRETHH